MNDTTHRRETVEQLAEEFARRYRAGERPSIDDYAAAHPEHAAVIRELFPALVLMEELAPSDAGSSSSAGAAPSPAETPLPERIGDYRILREVGRGGMGVVYEAEQESLGRRVALKVLPLHAGRDAKLLARFRRESRAAGQLHHTNIVPVFEVGQHDDHFYYAMQFIPGQALDEILKELQRLRAASGARQADVAAPGPVTQSLWAGGFAPAPMLNPTEDFDPAADEAGVATVCATAERTVPAALSGWSDLSAVESDFRLYCRNVARIGLQAAEALAYAHGRGVVHRDVKPSNLLLDTAGVVWVSDFGLAKTQDHALTETGDVVGTVRYMAPERFRGECDARADVYALGLTLYELLTLRPAFDTSDRLRLMDQIAHLDPPRPRARDPRIPRDLETIVMKAINKDPCRRYPSADDLAEDLRHFLADEPIAARRSGPAERLARWARRNPLVATLTAAIVLVTACGFAATAAQARAAQQERDEVRALNDRLQRTLYAAHMNLAHNAWDAGGVERVLDLLQHHRPKAGASDLRGFEWHYLNRLCHAELVTLKGHTGTVWSVAFGPDGKRLTSSGGGELKVWDAQTGQELLSFKGQRGEILGGTAFSPDGKRLVSSGGIYDNAKRTYVSGVTKIWNAQTGQELLTLKGHTDWVESVTFSPDGLRLASASRDNAVKVWDAQTGQELRSLKGYKYGVYSITFSPDGKRLASAGWGDQMVKVWDALTGQELLTFKVYSNSVAFSPDGKRLASAGGDRTVKVWDAQTGQELYTFKGHTDEVLSLAFSPDGKHLASASKDGTVKVWDAQPVPKPLTLTLKGGTDTSVVSVAFSPDGKRLASASNTWDATKNAHVAREVKVWDTQTGQELLALQGHTDKVTVVVFSPDGKRLVSGSGRRTSGTPTPGEVKVWDALTGQELLALQGHTDMVTGVAISPDGKHLASGSLPRAGEVKVWDALTGRVLHTLKAGGSSLAYSPDGKRLASAGNEVKVWDVQTGQELLTCQAPATSMGAFAVQARNVAFSPDGKRLASPYGDNTVKVWDAQTGVELLTLKGHTELVFSIVFSPDGKRLASTSGDKTVKVWDAQSGEELLTCKGHDGRVNSVAFTPNGHWLASGSSDGTVKIWDATPLPAKP